MKKSLLWQIPLAALADFLMIILGAASGAIHPACFAYAGTVLPLLFAFAYLFVAAKMQCFGAAVVLNGVSLLILLIGGEGNPALIIGMVLVTVLAEVLRRVFGYNSIKGVRVSFVPLAYSFYAYTLHWWTETEHSLEEAVEEMPAGYADKMARVIDNIPVLIIMLILVIPVAILAMRLAEKVMKKSSDSLSLF